MNDAVIDVPKLVEILDEIVSSVPADYGAVCFYTDRGMAHSNWEEGEWAVNDEGQKYILPRQPFEFNEPIKPVCIAGQVVYKLGGEKALGRLVEFSSIAPSSEENWPSTGVRSNDSVLDELGFTPDAKEALRKAQVVQDRDNPWTEAVDEIRV